MVRNMGLFRGKRTDAEEWVVGYYVRLYDHKKNVSHRIYTGYAETDCGMYFPDWFEVDPGTLGGCAGITDKNGNPIFDGDILGQGATRGTVEYDPEKAAYMYRWRMWGERSDPYFKTCKLSDYGFLRNLEIIGNIHDSPDMMR